MRRRHFITLIGSAAAWAFDARAQQPAMPVVGCLDAGTPEESANRMPAFRKGLGETGFIEGHNVAIEFRWAHNDYNRLPELAADLVRHRVAVIAVPSSTPAALAAKTATSIIPIVFGVGSDPVKEGLVNSLSRPGANVTGVSFMSVELAAKRLEIMHELLPRAARFALLVNPANPLTQSLIGAVRVATAVKGWQLEVLAANSSGEISSAFVKLKQVQVDALMIAPDGLFYGRRVQLATLEARYAVPTIYPAREHAEAGGLMSYATNLPDLIRLVGVYTGRILKGAEPADLPVLQPAKFEFVINLQTAKTLGIEIPPTLLARADEVIE